MKTETANAKKARLLSLIAARKAANRVPRVDRRDQASELETLSFAQQGLWFVSQLEGPNPAYNNSIIIRIAGALDVEALHRTISALGRRHDSLRTRFIETDGVPSQYCDATAEVRIEVESVGTGAEAIFLSEARRPFNLRTDLPFRVKLYEKSSERFALIISMHHIISDAWSMGLFVREMVSLYDAFSNGREMLLDALPVTYLDYVHWERNWLDNRVLEQQLEYWLSRLKDFSPSTALLPDFQQLGSQSSAGNRVDFAVPLQLLKRLQSLSKDNSCSVFVTLLTGLAVVLHRYSSEGDIAIGTAVSNRRSSELEGLIGYFVNTLVLRLTISPGLPVASTLKMARQTFLEALEHQDAPYHRVVQELPPESRMGDSPFQVMFTFQNVDWQQQIQLPSLTMELDLPSTGGAKFDLAISIQEVPEGLRGQIEYRSALFQESTIRRFTDHYLRALAEIAAHPELEIGEIEILGEEERRQIVEEWNATTHEVPRASLPELFEAQVEKTPDRTALVYEDEVLTYGELNRRANQLAHYLIEKGIGPESIVGLALPRCPEIMIGVLGIVKAGGAYLPLDPEYPPERLAFMIEDADLACLLTVSSVAVRLPEQKEKEEDEKNTMGRVVLDSGPIREKLGKMNPDNPGNSHRVQPLLLSHPAYVIYTSGSTGKPKGVIVQHQELTNYLSWSNRSYYQCDGTGSPAIHSIAFDGLVTTLYGPILAGQKLTLFPQGSEIDCLHQQGLLANPFTLVKVTPTHLKILNQNIESDRKESSTLALMIGGEALVPHDVAFWQRRFPKVRLINHFGPTETTVGCCTFEISEAISEIDSVPIGRPIWNTQLYVLDAGLEPVPVGASGELYIAGGGLARGYLKRPELTAERFIPNPFGQPGSRIYRTGDRVFWRADGELVFMGRADEQIKIGGFRIEPGEIESVLRSHESVAQAVVIAREDLEGQKRLVGYVVTRAGDLIDSAALRRYVADKLPDYMVPVAIVALAELPLSPSGKLDRRALPAPEFNSVTKILRAPRTPEEEILAGLFAEVLHLERVGIDDNFFEIGGHSLLVARLISRIRSTLGVELTIRTLFESPSVSSLAQKLPGAQRAKRRLQPRSRPAFIPLSSGQKRMWFLRQMEGPGATYNVPVAIRLEGVLNTIALREALNDVLGRQEILRTVFCQGSEGPRQRILGVEEVPEFFSERDISGEDLEVVLNQAAAYGFDLEREIPLRVWLLRLEEQRHVLLVLLHHIATDGWSMAPLGRDLSVAYNARCRGEEPRWAALPVQYADYSLWQAERLGEEDDEHSGVSRQLQYWKEKLSDLPPEMDLPRDRTRPAVSSHRGEEVSFRLSANLHEKLLEVAQEQGATLFMVLQAGLAALLMRMGAVRDVVLGSPIAGRNDDALNDLVGFFVNTLVLRTDTSGNPSFEELVGRVREDDLNAYAHQELPFEHLVEVLNPERSPNQHPLFQVMLVLQNDARSELELTGLKTNLEWSGTSPSKLDLRFNVREDRRGGEAQGIQGHINYAVDLFDQGTVERLAARLKRLLEAAGEDPSRRIGEIEILGEEERRQIVEEWNATKHEVPQASLPELFEAQVEKTPDRTAVVYEDQQLTYGELNRRANQLAHYLIDKGIGPESIVGLALPRCPEMMVGLLGIVKAGAAYLPLDPEYPTERLAFMIEDAHLACLLTVSSVAARLPEQKEEDEKKATRRVVLDTTPIQEKLDKMNPANPGNSHRVQPLLLSHPAYVIYTSGSTGKPKGVIVTHEGIGNLLASQVERFAITNEARILQFASISFDASVSELVTALAIGAALVMTTEEERNGTPLQHVLEGRSVTHATLPPTVALTLLADTKWPLTTLIIAGEPCPAELVIRCSKKQRMINAYGPTEATVCATMSDAIDCTVAPPIGRPIWNAQFYALSDVLEPVPVGVKGELYIGGAGLARGYLGRPELTAERFVPNPFGAPGSRMYRTGDLGCWREDGAAEYLGRNDFQVKIRGFRIEPGEIESVLGSHESVAQAVVVDREDSPGQKQLVGYVVPRDGEQIAALTLRHYVAERLPDYMVPAAIIVLAELPLSPNRKLDRKALPAPEFSSGAKSLRAPRTPEEEILAGLFADVLHLERVGIDDNFFDVGGHSLLATLLISRVRSTLGVELTIRTLFESPTVAGLAQQLPGAQRAKKRLQPCSRPDFIPLSFAQKRLWFLQQMEGPGPIYNVPVAIRLEGWLNKVALRRSLNDVLGRHEILRTVFCQDREGPQQRVLEVKEVPQFFFERQIGAEDVQMELNEAAAYGFDLEREIPLRVWLLWLEEQRHVLLVLLHHIATDGWSMAPLGRDLSVAYNARCRGEEPRWAALPVQYADYSLWQAERLGEEDDEHSGVSRQLQYWKEKLSDLPPEMDLPRDRTRPAVSSHRGEEVSFRLSANLHEKLLEVAQEQGATLFMVLQAGLAALLMRMGSGTDIVLGSLIAGRNDDALNDLVGFFVNTLVLRTDTSGNPSFEELVGRVREDDLNAYAHQELPFEHLVEVLNPERSPNQHPLFQVMLVLQNNAPSELELTGLKTNLEWSGEAPAVFDLTFNVREDRRGGEAQGIHGRINYAVDLFDRGTVEKLAQRLERILEAAGEDPSRRIGEIEILGEEERRQIVEEWNATKHEVPNATLPDLFEAQVEKTPDRTAVVHEHQRLTYGGLNRRANRLAHYLRTLGIGPDSRVGICVERSPEMIAAAFAVLKAGGAYVPLDPEFPLERVRWMVEDGALAALLLDPMSKQRFREICTSVPVIDVTNVATWEDQPENNLSRAEVGLTAEHSVYVIYTSGSTGRPKGVMVTQAAVGNFLSSMQREIGCDADDTLMAITTWSFDIAGLEVYWPLTRGACVKLLRREEGRDGARLLEGLQNGVTMMQATPANWRILVEAGWKGTAGLKALCGGEALDADLASSLVSKSASTWNMYGPTETTIWSLIHKLGETRARVAIGRPIGNTQVYILNEQGQPVPAGVGGEVYICGAGLARGYLKRPELTAERFVPNPFGEPGSRMYCTGDLGCWRRDGVVEYLGRNDFQVKIRGFRIEPEEIEAVLRSRESVAQAVVVARETSEGQKQLVGYVVARAGEQIDAAALRRNVAEKLPDYMVPAAIMVLAELPLSPSGKLDRKALPAPEFSSVAKSTRAPRTPEEEILAGLFAEVLHLERVGIDDNFFEVGGHSLLAMRLISRLRTTLGVELGIRTLFEEPTIAGLALRLSGAHSTKRPLQPHSRSTFIPLSFAQKRLWFLQQMDGPSPAYNMPVAIRLEGALNRGALRKALNDVLGRHEILRTVFCQDSEGPQQRILDLEEVPEFFFERQIGGEDVELVLNQTATYGFDLEREIPLRVWLLRLEEQQHVLLVLLHHIATDGWSMAPLGRDLSVAYNARCHGEEPRWIALPVQYADYSLWQAERLGEQSDEHSSVSRQLRYWREKLSELPPEMDLPRDRMRPAVSSHSGGGLHFRLSASLHKKLLEVARELGATLFMVLQAGLAALLTRLGAGTDIVLGSPIAGRNDDALNDLVGFFVNTLVLRTDTSGNPNFEELVGRVREDDLNAYAHQELPFEHLVEMLNPERSLNRHPLFQVMLLLQNNARPELELIGLKVRPEWSEAAPAIFDLTFNLREDRRGGEAHGIQGQINYAADLFDRGTVEKLAERLERVLEAVGEDPSQRIGEMEILGDEERRQIVEEWNATKHEVPHATMPELFEAQVEKTPHRTAVVYEGELLTYGELNRRANKLAHYLLELGVGPDTKVAICVERSLEMMEALLGVLKAGGLYIPLDPGYPMERLRYMLEDSEPIAVVTQPHLRELFSGRTATVPVIEVGNGGRAWSDRSENNPLRSATGLSSQHLAYMIYTSGSTGMPKGAMNEHRGVVNRLVWMQRAYGLNADDAVLQKTPFSFDVSVWELFWPLFVGARLVMAQPEGHKDPTYLAETIQQANVTTMHFVPSMLEVFLRQAYPERCSTLVRVVCSGEALSSTVARRFKEKLSSCALHNLYGPTEAAVDVTAWTCPSTIEKDKIPIGRPIANTSIYILDGRGEPVPVGVVGQIYIGGVQVARGYLNRPELTAEKFLPDPIAAEVGVRMYGTGDLGKWRPDGNIEFLGRNDQQIKIRGFRIELGEIEAALTKHAKLGEAVVLARESTPGDTRLVVYYTVRGDIEPDDIVAEDLRRYLTAKLPEYMVPAAYMRLEGLPLTPNGKLDRKKLPAPGAPAYAVPAFESPQGEVETALASIWAELLKVQRVGRRDNFFDLGGHSLLIIQLASRLRSAFGVEVPVRAFFDAPTLLEMTHTIAVSQIEDENSEEILQEIRELSQMSPDQVKNLLEPLRNSTQ